MMSAGDLILFARAHLEQGVGASGARIVSKHSATAMQTVTVSNRGKGYAHVDMGIGWMISAEGLLTHWGGGPGIVSALYVHPERRFAAAVLTNAEHGAGLIKDLLQPFLRDVGIPGSFGAVDISLPRKPVSIDVPKYLGVYEDVLIRYRVSATPDGLAVSRQEKFACYGNVSTEVTPPAGLIPLGDDKFLLQSDTKAEITSQDASRVFEFRNAGVDGHMRHLGNSLRLYLRAQ
jgi:hypothetical protein